MQADEGTSKPGLIIVVALGGQTVERIGSHTSTRTPTLPAASMHKAMVHTKV